MKAVIMAGGKGTRLKEISGDVPKPMVKINGKPILEYQIDSLRESGITDIVLIVGYLGDVVKEYFKDGSSFGVSIRYITEDVPLGTAGALYYLKEETEDFFLVFGDLILDIDWMRFMSFHKAHGAYITLFGHPNAHPYDSDIIEQDGDGRVMRILPKNEPRDFYYHNFVNAGIYCVSPKALDKIEAPEKIDLEKNVIASLIPNGKVYVYKSTEYIKDAGTPDRFKSIGEDIKRGTVGAKNLKKEQKCIFLDRDGTLNEYVGFMRNIDDFNLISGVSDAIKKVNESGYLSIVATNQPVIARGEVTFEELDDIHKKLEVELGKGGAYIDDLYFCPHHPDSGFEGEVKELKIDCDCRKPKTGMLVKASKDHNISLSSSWFIGDTTSDIKTGINAGMKTCLLRTGIAGKDAKYDVTPDMICDTLNEAVEKILAQ